MKIRPVEPRDLENCAELFKEAFPIDEHELCIFDLTAAVMNKQDGDYAYAESFVYEIAGEIIGICGCYRLFDTPVAFCGVNWMAVKRTYRGKGIGTELLTFCERIAEKDYSNMFVFSDKSATPFYLRNGYTFSDDIRAREFADWSMEGSDFLTKTL
jgi:GNAT superfamily N-acetyltransferase